MRCNVSILVDIYNINDHTNQPKMGQVLSRDDDECQQDQDKEQCQEQEQEHLEEKPKRRQRNGAVRSRKAKSSVQGRTRRKTVSFD